MICGGYYKVLIGHLIGIHGVENGEEYRREFPDAPMVAEQTRIKTTMGNSTVAHWEPILSMEFVLDRCWFWHSRHGACNHQFMLLNDPSIPSYAANRGVKWDDVMVMVGLEPHVERSQKISARFNRESVMEALRRRHEMGQRNSPACIQTDNAPLYKAARKAFGNVAKALEVCGLPPHDVNETSVQSAANYPDKNSVINAVIAHAKKGYPLTNEALALADRPLLLAVLRHFRTLTACIEEVGLKENHVEHRHFSLIPTPAGFDTVPKLQYPNADAVVEGIRERHRRGASLFQNHVVREDPKLKSSAYVYCGTWKNAIRMAGLEDEVRRARKLTVRKDAVYPSKEAIIQALKERARLGKGISQGALCREDRPLKNAIYRYYGTMEKAREAADLGALLEMQKKSRQKLKRASRQYGTPQSVIDALVGRAARGESLLQVRVVEQDGKLKSAAYHWFGTWMKAIDAAGLEEKYVSDNPSSTDIYPDADSVLEEIRRRHREGFSIGSRIVQKEDCKLKTAAYRLFASWARARRMAGLP